MAASVKTPLWKRLVIVLSAVAAGIVVAAVTGEAGGSWLLTIVFGAAVIAITFLVAAKLLSVPLKRGWE
jgi:hypothetical protein